MKKKRNPATPTRFSQRFTRLPSILFCVFAFPEKAGPASSKDSEAGYSFSFQEQSRVSLVCRDGYIPKRPAAQSNFCTLLKNFPRSSVSFSCASMSFCSRELSKKIELSPISNLRYSALSRVW